MLHRRSGNLDELIGDSLPFLTNANSGFTKTGVVESGDPKTGVMKVKDSQSGQTVDCVVLQENYNSASKSGTFNLPTVGSSVLYMMDGGTKGIILGNLYKAVPSGQRTFADGTTNNSGFENFGDADGPTSLDIDSDFGWDLGERGWITPRGSKIKLLNSGIIILKSSPFCYQYMLPARQARLSQFFYDEERGIGYLKRRRTFICPLSGTSFNANYKVEQVDDIPADPQATLRIESGFIDKQTAASSLNHQSDLDISGHIANALISAKEILKSRAIHRMTIATTKKVQGQRTVFLPVYKNEKRIDGTVVEQSGHAPGSPFYNLEIVKSPLGYMHVVARRAGTQPTAILKMDANTGEIMLMAEKLTLSAALGVKVEGPMFEVDCPIVNIHGQTSLNLYGGIINQKSDTVTNMEAGVALNVASAGTTQITSAGTLDLTAGGAANLSAGGQVGVNAGADLALVSGGTASLFATVNLTCMGLVNATIQGGAATTVLGTNTVISGLSSMIFGCPFTGVISASTALPLNPALTFSFPNITPITIPPHVDVPPITNPSLLPVIQDNTSMDEVAVD